MKSLPRKRSETVSRFHPPSGRVERSEGRAEYQFSTHAPRPEAVRPSRREGEVQNQYAEVVSERILSARCRLPENDHATDSHQGFKKPNCRQTFLSCGILTPDS